MGAVCASLAARIGRAAVAVTTIALLAGGCEPRTPAAALRADPLAIKRGKLLFAGTCAGYCHSVVAERDAPNLFDCTWRHGNSDQKLFDNIATGIPNTPMEGFRKRLPEGDDDVWRLVAYITTAGADCG